MSDGYDASRIPRRTLAGATILQIVSALVEEPNARAAVNVAFALLQAGARALVAAKAGPLVNELRSFGADWVELRNETVNPFRLHKNAGVLESLIGAERIDIVHAQSAGGAWSARVAASRIAVWLVTTLPDAPAVGRRWPAPVSAALAQGDRIIAPSAYAATPVMQRYGLSGEQVTIIPREIDTAVYNPLMVAPERSEALRQAWKIPDRDRVVVVPGRVAAWNGQAIVPQLARALADEGIKGLTYAIVGEHATYRGYAREIMKQARELGVGRLLRLTGHCPDVPAALAVADIVLVTAVEAPLLGSIVAQAQAMARPVITTDVGMLPEHVLVPPRMPEELRTGWVVAAADPLGATEALKLALRLDSTEYQAMAARARQFAEYMFSPQSAAVATRAVYMSLLARDL
ncbi:MAG TPA: glycosyltransferase [Xanthobacteraceae bacterium]|nr:glycosyltransferase [Xanthobacteraceae bacterium]